MLKNLYYIAILTFVVVVSWIGFEVYNSNVTSTITADKSVIITPIPPEFNQAMIIAIKSKKIVPANLSENASRSAVSTITSPTPTPTVAASPTSSSSPIIQPPVIQDTNSPAPNL